MTASKISMHSRLLMARGIQVISLVSLTCQETIIFYFIIDDFICFLTFTKFEEIDVFVCFVKHSNQVLLCGLLI